MADKLSVQPQKIHSESSKNEVKNEKSVGFVPKKPFDRPPMTQISTAKNTELKEENWATALDKVKKSAFMIPILALISSFLGVAAEGKIEGLMLNAALLKGGKEIVVLAIAILCFRIARDLARILARFRVSEIGVDVAKKDETASYLITDYVRPVDVFVRYNPEDGSRVSIVMIGENLRNLGLWGVFLFIMIFVMRSEIESVLEMWTKPSIEPYSKYIAGISVVFILLGLLDAVSALIFRWPRFGSLSVGEWGERVNDIEERARKLRNALDLPTIWPPPTFDEYYKVLSVLESSERAEEQYKRLEALPPDAECLFGPVAPETWPPADLFDLHFLKMKIDIFSKAELEQPKSIEQLISEFSNKLSELPASFPIIKPVLVKEYGRGPKSRDEIIKEIFEKEQKIEYYVELLKKIAWCRAEGSVLRKPVRLPYVISNEDEACIDYYFEKILFQRWCERGEVWRPGRGWARAESIWFLSPNWFSAVRKVLSQIGGMPRPIRDFRRVLLWEIWQISVHVTDASDQ